MQDDEISIEETNDQQFKEAQVNENCKEEGVEDKQLVKQLSSNIIYSHRELIW